MTPLDICNQALAHLGESPIRSIDPSGTLPQRCCYRWYHPTRREELCCGQYAFSERKSILINHGRGFRVPDDCIRLRGLRDVEMDGRTITACNGGEISPDGKLMVLRYTADVENTDEFSDEFVRRFALRLALRMCMTLTESPSIKDEIREKLNETEMAV
ncbi:MAG: hypothetical protein Q4C88_08645 [Akkermansia sp.]|nr:hypothetical protein [Akkermansia sp.]